MQLLHRDRRTSPRLHWVKGSPPKRIEGTAEVPKIADIRVLAQKLTRNLSVLGTDRPRSESGRSALDPNRPNLVGRFLPVEPLSPRGAGG